MDLFDKFRHIILLTRTERRVMLFLAAALIVGAGIKLSRTAFRGGGLHDYRGADSVFAERSAASRIEDSLGGLRAATGRRSGKKALPAPGSVDLNRAAKEDLMRLPGIGELTAERIVLYRRENGRFRKVTDLALVKGIGKKRLERIIPYCIVGK